MKINEIAIPFPEDKMKGMSPPALEFFRSCWDDANDIEEFPEIAEERLGIKLIIREDGRMELKIKDE